MIGVERRHRVQSRRGFALIITVALLALLVLVLVALATLTRVDTSIGTNSRIDAQARQNALYALNVAIGELQRNAGPDARITAQSDIVAGVNQHHWTGVWDANTGSLQTWLVSGVEQPNPPPPATPLPPPDAGDLVTGLVATPLNALTLVTSAGNQAALLVGPKSAGTTSTDQYVVAPLVELHAQAAALGSTSLPVTIGRYAWWVGDDGTKASMALPDRWADVTYGPYASDELHNRLRQQVPLTHESFRATGASGSPLFGFDPALPANSAALPKILSRPQLAFLASADGNTLVPELKTFYHDWTTVSYGVFASTDPNYPGLKRDLSTQPDLLGPGFAAWSNYSSYIESIPSPASVDPRIDSANDFRRRYSIAEPSTISPVPNQVVKCDAPVISDFLIQFFFRRQLVPTDQIQIKTRVHVEMWNPYTSALVPEELHLDVLGLPSVLFSLGGAETPAISLQNEVNAATPGNLFRLRLRLDTGANPPSDQNTWIPGRVYNWRTDQPASPSIPSLLFSAKLLVNSPGWSLANVASPVDGGGPLTIREDPSSPTSLTLILRNQSDQVLAQYKTPSTTPWITSVPNSSDSQNDSAAWCVAFGMRTPQPCTDPSRSFPSWLSTAGTDPRRVNMPEVGVTFHDPVALSPTDPAYVRVPLTNWDASGGNAPGFILNRQTGGGPGNSYANDTPIFELPRGPILSLGMLQHLQVSGQGAFALGTSSGLAQRVAAVDGGDGTETFGEWYDRYFFSGMSASGTHPDFSLNEALPFFHLRLLDTRTGATPPLSVSDLQAAIPYSSRYLLMGGAFNVNSTSAPAWSAILKSLRPAAKNDWDYVELVSSSGGAKSDGAGNFLSLTDDLVDSSQGSIASANSGAAFFRFSQTAQETFDADNSGTVSGFNRSCYRQGVRGGSGGNGEQLSRNLTSEQLDALATRISLDVRNHGPFLSLRDFLKPTIGGLSVIEDAIANATFPDGSPANINVNVPDMSSYYLTQGDVLTAIAPFLQARSDTFTIRTYGEVVNPVLLNSDGSVPPEAIQGRAWCEAVVQRIPSYVDNIHDEPEVTALTSSTNQQFGRRFQIVSFRWLSPDDI